MSFLKQRRKGLRVAVLGCGPSGLFAAHAFAELGYNFTILSKKRRSEMFGAQYLHEPIPGLTAPKGVPLKYSLRGTLEQYSQKVYGDSVSPSMTSPARLPEDQTAYDIRLAYYKAWDLYQDRIANVHIQSSLVIDFVRAFDVVVSTIPATQICTDTLGVHKFDSQKVWAIGDAPERGIFCPVTVEPQSVVCNGEPTPGWYRASNVFGYKTAEWPWEACPPISNIAPLEKPVKTNCDCWAGKRFLRAGRYGTWTKGVLSHQAYYEIRERY